ncbi:MAG: nuclear transport factor 2 family protein [Betaproteobacteria bacterium]|nr:nuclear transport factor 2 family protein [Betaproteobacteria bacterium]
MHDAQHVTPELVAAVNAVFARHDAEGIANAFADDGVFINAKGMQLSGDTYRGRDAIRAFFAQLFRATPEVQWIKTEPAWMMGDKVVTQWHRKAVSATGESSEWLGTDLYVYCNHKIVRKDTYVKIVLPAN